MLTHKKNLTNEQKIIDREGGKKEGKNERGSNLGNQLPKSRITYTLNP